MNPRKRDRFQAGQHLCPSLRPFQTVFRYSCVRLYVFCLEICFDSLCICISDMKKMFLLKVKRGRPTSPQKSARLDHVAVRRRSPAGPGHNPDQHPAQDGIIRFRFPPLHRNAFARSRYAFDLGLTLTLQFIINLP